MQDLAIPFRLDEAADVAGLALHERKASYQAPRGASGSSSDRVTRSRRPVAAAVSVPVGLHLKPGQEGTKHLVAQYGERLVCVRYRYDGARRKRIKTVELVVAEANWERRYAPDEIVAYGSRSPM